MARFLALLCIVALALIVWLFPANAALTVDGGRCHKPSVSGRSLTAGGWSLVLATPRFAIFQDRDGYTAVIEGGSRVCAQVTPPFVDMPTRRQ
jgi:hypothetical protein